VMDRGCIVHEAPAHTLRDDAALRAQWLGL
jgi:hypothetical protein